MLKVSAKTSVAGLGQSIRHALDNSDNVEIQAIGERPGYIAAKGIASARNIMGLDLVSRIQFVDNIETPEGLRTALVYHVQRP